MTMNRREFLTNSLGAAVVMTPIFAITTPALAYFDYSLPVNPTMLEQVLNGAKTDEWMRVRAVCPETYTVMSVRKFKINGVTRLDDDTVPILIDVRHEEKSGLTKITYNMNSGSNYVRDYKSEVVRDKVFLMIQHARAGLII
jgi:hypothetical protein